MYISRVEIDYGNRRNLKKLSNITSFHSYVEESFPDELSNNERTRKLWRIDQLAGKTYLIVVSESKPNTEKFEHFGIKGSSETKDYDPFLNRIENGQKARFKIVLNPTISIKEDENKRGKVIPLKSSDFKKFLIDRAYKNGFILEENDFEISARDIENFKHGKDNKGIKLDKVTYEGILTIIDKEKMIHTLTHGMGKKKAYGFGLMTLILEN